MSKKSNLKRTHRRRKTKTYNEAKVAAQHEDVVQQQKAAREAYREVRSIRQKKVFTAGAKAVIASVAIMLMFLAGLVSWSMVRNAKQRRDDDQTQQKQQPSQMVTAEMVTGMERTPSKEMSGKLRFSSFARTAGGYDGKAIFGGRTPSEGIDDLSAERARLEKDWQEQADKRATDSRYAEQSLADKAKNSDGTAQGDAEKAADGTSESTTNDANASRYKVVDSTDNTQVDVSVSPDDTQGDSKNDESSVTDEQIRKLIDSAEATSSR